MENKEELKGKEIIIEDSTIEYIEPKQQFVRPPMSKWNQLILAFYWFSSNMVWQAQLGIAMPYQVRAAVGDEKKGTYFGLVTAIGAGLSLIAAPIFGALSDRIKLPGGKRKPWVVIGTVGNIFALIGMGYLIKPGEPDTIYLWALCYMIFIIFNNVAVAPYTALIPDLVPLNQRGSASGMMGLMTLLGNFAGGSMGFFVDSLGVANIYWIMIISLILGMLVVWFGVKELNLENHEPVPFRVGEFLRSLKDPFENNDFKWVFYSNLGVLD
jgi:MFS family permease